MRRRPIWRALLTSLVVAASLAGWSPTSRAARDELGPLRNCITKSRELTVAMVIDESGSLQDTDPGDERVTAAKAALAGLVALTSQGSAQVDLLIAGFSETFETRREAPLTDQSVAGLIDQIEQFSARDTGRDTDFHEAIDGARRWLDEKRAASDGGFCSLLLLFTDGEYSIEPQPGRTAKSYAPGVPPTSEDAAARVASIGQQKVCGENGVSDRLRALGTIPVVLSLNKTSFDQSFIKSFATGVGCGNRGQEVPGVFQTATDLSDLLQLFDAVARDLLGETSAGTQTTEACVRSACPSGTRSFRIDDSLSRFHLLVDLESENLIAQLRSPGRPKPLTIRGGDSGGARLGAIDLLIGRLSSTAFTIDATRPKSGKGWTGKWEVTFIDPTGTNPGAIVHSQIYLYGDLIPEFQGSPEFRIGTPTEVEVRIARRDGEPVEPADFLQDVQLDLSVTDPTTSKTERIPVEGSLEAGVFIGEYQPPDETTSSVLNLNARLTSTTSSGIALVPTSARVPAPVLPPAGFPSLADNELILRQLVAATAELDSAATEVQIIGPDNGTGCIWFSGDEFRELPPETSAPTLAYAPDATDEASCVSLESGERKTLTLTMSEPEGGIHGSGVASGFLDVQLKSDATGEVISRKVPFSADVIFKKSVGATVVAAIPIFLIGVGLPIFALWLLNFLGAKFQPPAHARVASVSVKVAESGVISRADGRPLSEGGFVSHDDFQNVGGPTQPTREFNWRRLHFRAKTPVNPFGQPRGEVAGSYVAGSGGFRTVERGAVGHIDLALTRTWLFVLDPTSAVAGAEQKDIRGDLVLLISDTEPAVPQVDAMWSSIEAGLPASAIALASEASKHQEKEVPPDPGVPDSSGPLSYTDEQQLPPAPDF